MILHDKEGKIVSIESLTQYSKLAIYPGSFNPLHHGHKGIYDLVKSLGFHTIFEISRTRYEKQPYPEEVIRGLTKQFIGYSELLISEAPLFSEKRDQLSWLNPFWIMGYDTAKRWIDENKKVDAQEKKLIDKMKVIFVGRLSDGTYHDPRNLLTGDEKFECQIIDFKCDVSSTQIRREKLQK